MIFCREASTAGIGVRRSEGLFADSEPSWIAVEQVTANDGAASKFDETLVEPARAPASHTIDVGSIPSGV